MQLTLSKSTIRSFRPTDAASITKHVGTYSVTRNMSSIPYPYTINDAECWIATATSHTPERHFAIAVDDEAVGGIGLEIGDSGRIVVCDHCAEIGYWLSESFWGRGIMSEAASALTEWAFATLGLIRIHAAVYARNSASARVLEKTGYQLEGRQRARYLRDGELIDGLMYAMVRMPR